MTIVGESAGGRSVHALLTAPEARGQGVARALIEGVYAAGDAVEGLDQISVAMGTGARAAVAIHNDLRQSDGQTLED